MGPKVNKMRLHDQTESETLPTVGVGKAVYGALPSVRLNNISARIHISYGAQCPRPALSPPPYRL